MNCALNNNTVAFLLPSKTIYDFNHFLLAFIFILINCSFFSFRDAVATNSACRKLAVSLADSVSLRALLSLLYTMTQVLRNHDDDKLKETFINELSMLNEFMKNDLFLEYLN